MYCQENFLVYLLEIVTNAILEVIIINYNNNNNNNNNNSNNNNNN